jgi:uncharacterized protein YdhG (YjbR/CyaY superfamily)
MKKAKLRASRSTAKNRAASKSVDEYLAGVPEPARSTLSKLRAVIRATVPKQASEAISYGIPAFNYNGSLLWFAAFSNHCSFFPGSSVIRAFQKELQDYQLSKGTIRFAVDKPLPATLVRKLVKARIAEKKER